MNKYLLLTIFAILVAKSKKVNPIPAGFRTVTPYLSVEGGLKALEFYKRAFGAK
jgi:hypothetical protein